MTRRHRWFIMLMAAFALSHDALAHDNWIGRGGLRNAAGELCCGEGDCVIIPARDVQLRTDGYYLRFTYGHDTAWRAEIVPLAEAQPSPDGAYWRCKRPDGSRRCFFARTPNT